MPEPRPDPPPIGTPQVPYREVTVAAVVFAIVIGVIMNAAITYAGLKIGFTITGSAIADTSKVNEAVDRIKSHTNLPVCVGFGIKTPEGAEAMAKIADGAVVGSAIVAKIAEGKPVSEVLTFVKSLADGAHRA